MISEHLRIKNHVAWRPLPHASKCRMCRHIERENMMTSIQRNTNSLSLKNKTKKRLRVANRKLKPILI